jgi:hypothetical protein
MRTVEFGEWLCCDVLKRIPYRHFVFSIPKILRRYFLSEGFIRLIPEGECLSYPVLVCSDAWSSPPQLKQVVRS